MQLVKDEWLRWVCKDIWEGVPPLSNSNIIPRTLWEYRIQEASHFLYEILS